MLHLGMHMVKLMNKSNTPNYQQETLVIKCQAKINGRLLDKSTKAWGMEFCHWENLPEYTDWPAMFRNQIRDQKPKLSSYFDDWLDKLPDNALKEMKKPTSSLESGVYSPLRFQESSVETMEDVKAYLVSLPLPYQNELLEFLEKTTQLHQFDS